MSQPPRGAEADCAALASRVVPFLESALGEDERLRLERHIERCPRCSRRVVVERSFDRALRARVRRSATPEDLAVRVRAILAREAPTVREAPWRWVRTSGLAALAASVVLALVALPFVGGTSDRRAVPPGTLRTVREAVVVDGVCDRAGLTLEQQRACPDSRHLNALKCPDGRYWSVLLTDGRLRTLVLDPEVRGRRLVVEGEFYPAIMSVRVERWRDRDAADGVQAPAILGVPPQARVVPRGEDLATLPLSARREATPRARRRDGSLRA